MSNSSSSLIETLLQLSNEIGEEISKANYTPQEGSEISIKSTLFSLLPNSLSISQNQLKFRIVDFSLCIAALASASNASYSQLSWVPIGLSEKAVLAFKKLSDAYFRVFEGDSFVGFGEFGGLGNEKKLVIELLPKVLILIKQKIKESSIDTSNDDADRISAASARVPVAFAVLAAYQFKWFVTQIDYPFLGKLCNLIIPCGLTALDHWSPEVKGQGMVSFIHLAKNVNAAEIGVYEDVILDACCQSIAVSDEIWDLAVEMSVLMVTSNQRSNPHSEWYEKLLNEMLSHLERQPRDKSRRIAWLKNIDPLLNGIGLVLLAHFRRIFPLFFQWMHADDDETVLLVLDRTKTIIKLTWIRNSPYLERFISNYICIYCLTLSVPSPERRVVLGFKCLLNYCRKLVMNSIQLIGVGIHVACTSGIRIIQIDYPFLGKLCNLIIPCGLTALDHWSPEVKGQGMVSFIHLAKNVNAAEIGVYEDVILDACCQSIAVSDEIWDLAVEMSVLMVTSNQRSNPHSEWYEKLLNEMLSHLERQPRDKSRRIAWLKNIDPLLNGIGLVLLAHFRRIFPLFFQWMHADDDETVLLVLDRTKTIIKLTWIRNSPYLERLVDELINLYKEAALKIKREDIRTLVLQIIILIQQSKGSQFDITWDKHKNDPDLTALSQSLNRRDAIMA